MKKSKFIQLVIVGAALASASCQRAPIYSSNNNTGPILPPDSTSIRPDSTLFQGDTTGVYQSYYPYYYQYPYNQFNLNIRPYWGSGHYHYNRYYYGRSGSYAQGGAWGHATGGFGHVSHGGFGNSGHGFSAHS